MLIWCDASPTKLCIKNSEGLVELKDFSGTNQEAEYAAMILALTFAKDGDSIYSDSRLVVNQLTKNEYNHYHKWKIKAPNLIPFYNRANELLKSKKIEIKWISREENLAGHILEGFTGN